MNIRKAFKGGAVALLTIAILVSCQDKLEEQYLNPEKTTEASIGKFFTRMLDNRRVRADYWNIRTFLVMHPAVYTNTVSYLNTTKRYQQQLSYLDDFWKDFYTPNGTGAGGIMPHMREIEKAYEGMSAEEQASNDPYLHAARIVFYDQTAQMVDLWGDIPYFDAGSLNLNGQTTSPKFDKADEVYAALIEGLKASADYFATANPDALVQSAFGKQDLLMKGNLKGWQRYANSIRLRLLMRTSFQNESAAQTAVMEMLNTPASYPLVEENAQNILLDPILTYTDNMRNAVTELTSHIAPEFLVESVLKPASDPRIRALFDKNVSGGVQNADYNSMPANIPSSTQETNITAGKYAVLDSTTFMFNTKFPGIVITASEVNFLKAEALERWGSTANAQVAYDKALTQSVDFVFYLNGIGASFRGTSGEDTPTAGEITTFKTSPTVAYTGTSAEKLGKIWTQKWVNLGFMQSIEAWSEVRRTGYPALSFVPDNSTAGSEMPPVRLLYPGTEKVYNAANYAEVASKDNATTPVFWDVK